MPKKGVEPAALRRWRLAHRKGKKGKHRSHPKVRRHTSMARRLGRKRGHKSFKIPIISAAILAGQAYAAYTGAGGNLGGAVADFASYYTGYQVQFRRWALPNLAIGYGPWLVKRFLLPIARPRMPVHGLPISIS